MDAPALKALKAREWEGFGCESHEAKVKARKEAKVARNAEKNAKKKEKKEAAEAAGNGGRGGGKQPRKRKGKGGSGSEGEGPVLGKEGVVEKKGKSEEGLGSVAVVDEGVMGDVEEEEEEMAARGLI